MNDKTNSLNRVHARRLREIYRSAGWPCQDVVEIELLAAGLLERSLGSQGHESVRVTEVGIQYLAQAAQSNRSAFTAHQALVDKVAQAMLRDGRIVWTSLSLRARVPVQHEKPGDPEAPKEATSQGKWKLCQPDVFSIRNSSVQAYLEPIVHEIKVSRADLLGDLKRMEKRQAYLDIGGQCWYVLGCDKRGKPIAQADEVPKECGVMLCVEGQLEVLRAAPKRACLQLPFGVWMALAKATPVAGLSDRLGEDVGQKSLGEEDS
jgi:hypothetical protein